MRLEMSFTIQHTAVPFFHLIELWKSRDFPADIMMCLMTGDYRLHRAGRRNEEGTRWAGECRGINLTFLVSRSLEHKHSHVRHCLHRRVLISMFSLLSFTDSPPLLLFSPTRWSYIRLRDTRAPYRTSPYLRTNSLSHHRLLTFAVGLL